MSMGPPGRQ